VPQDYPAAGPAGTRYPGLSSPSESRPGIPILPENRSVRPLKKPCRQVDIRGLIWYIRAFDEKGVAFSRPFVVSRIH
jgi:hypothetical protein